MAFVPQVSLPCTAPVTMRRGPAFRPVKLMDLNSKPIDGAANLLLSGYAECVVGRDGLEPSTKGLCFTTSAFAARFRFVVWTLSCLSAFPSSLYTFPVRGFARYWHANFLAGASTEFEKFYVQAEQTYLAQPIKISHAQLVHLRRLGFFY